MRPFHEGAFAAFALNSKKISSKKFVLPSAAAAEFKSFRSSFFARKFLFPTYAFSGGRYFIAYLSPFRVSDALAEIFDKLLANNFHLLYLVQKENVNFCLPPFSNCSRLC